MKKILIFNLLVSFPIFGMDNAQKMALKKLGTPFKGDVSKYKNDKQAVLVQVKTLNTQVQQIATKVENLKKMMMLIDQQSHKEALELLRQQMITIEYVAALDQTLLTMLPAAKEKAVQMKSNSQDLRKQRASWKDSRDYMVATTVVVAMACFCLFLS